MTANRATGRAILSLQVLRGIAALSVVLFHTNLIMGKPKYGAMHVFDLPSSRGWMGVNLFFVLSGFIIFYAHWKDIGKPARLGTYLWRRFSRVYPSYWVFLTAFIVAALAGFGFISFRNNWGDLLSAYFLIQFVPNPTLPLKVAWTLVFEVIFYGAFGLLIVNRILGIATFIVWLAVILYSALVQHSLAMDWTSMWSVNFLLGALSFLLYRRLPGTLGLPIATGGVAMLIALLAFNPDYASIETQQAHAVSLLVLGIPFMLILLGAALAELQYGFVPPAWMLLLGDASFSIYLVHSAVISALCGAYLHVPAGILPLQLVLLGIFVAAVGAGLAAHFVVERPLVALARRVGQLSTRAAALDRLRARLSAG